ncbi:LOW QUALITY PROTEIN: ATP-dependent RNA helicase A protein-like, partial [Scomber scombrus]|uniref:LOW QUALITY PROTEIN: ATP-dependent RNA helicase A protein-like n=1 Tax=Scomber scombrus TaxID=13677 RepID=UPI002DDAB45A
MADIKNFLYAWCGKKKLTPSYDIRAAGNKNRPKFMCEVRVDTYNYTGMGNSTNKKDAQTNAARDFVNYLVRLGDCRSPSSRGLASQNVISLTEEEEEEEEGGNGGFGNLPPSGPLPPHLVVKIEKDDSSSGPVPGVTGLGYSGGGGAGGGARGGGGQWEQGAAEGGQWERGANLKEYYAKRDEQEAQATLESEEVDLNANLHGNWTLENAKARLNQFFQKEKTSAEYKYSQVGPDHNRSFIAEMQLFVRQLGRRVTAREHGSNKKLAAQSCALSLVRQLYHLAVIEAYSGITKKKEGERLPAALNNVCFNLEVCVCVSSWRRSRSTFVRSCNRSFLLSSRSSESPSPHLLRTPAVRVSLLQGKIATFEPSQRQTGAGVIPWSPPQVNWNPWTSSNIDEGPLAFCTPEQISGELHDELMYQLEHDDNLQKMLSA